MKAAVPLFLFAQTPQWKLIFMVSYAAWLVFEIWVFSRDCRAARGDKRDRGSIVAIFFFITLGIAVTFAAPHFVPLARIPLPSAPVFYTAMTLFWLGMVLRLWAIATLGRYFRTAMLVLDDHRLVTSGPYRVLRHPAYTGGVMTLAGLGLATGNWISTLGATICILLAYAWRIRVEEKALHERFGPAFEVHRRRTWAILPFVW